MTTELRDKLAVVRERGTAAVAKDRLTIYDLVVRMRDQFATALPRQLDADRFVRVAMTSLRTNPKLLACDQNSLLAALMLSAQLGLEPGGPLGHAYLVPYGKELTFIVGYKGYIDLARRSGQVTAVYAEPVHEGDEFRVSKGLHRDIVHEPAWKPGAPLTYVYAVARIQGEEPQFVVLTKDKVDAYRKRSKASSNGPWVTDYEAMALKTAVRRLSPWLPMSVEFSRAVAADEAIITPGTTIEAFDVVPADEELPEPSGTADLETGEIKPESDADTEELPLKA